VLAGGNCTTDGFHSAVLRVPEKPKLALFGGGPARDRLAKLSKKGIDTAADIQNKALRPALFSLLEGGPENLNDKNKHVKGWTEDAVKPFTQKWNPRFFDWLWSTVDISDDTEALRPWFNELRRLAQETLDRASKRAPQRHGRSYRAKTKAQGIFFGSLKENFPHFIEVTHDEP
jgi:CRISPR system Cascade subunit CasA